MAENLWMDFPLGDDIKVTAILYTLDWMARTGVVKEMIFDNPHISNMEHGICGLGRWLTRGC